MYNGGSLIILMSELMAILAQSLGYPFDPSSILGLCSIMSELNPWAVPLKVLAQSCLAFVQAQPLGCSPKVLVQSCLSFVPAQPLGCFPQSPSSILGLSFVLYLFIFGLSRLTLAFSSTDASKCPYT